MIGVVLLAATLAPEPVTAEPPPVHKALPVGAPTADATTEPGVAPTETAADGTTVETTPDATAPEATAPVAADAPVAATDATTTDAADAPATKPASGDEVLHGAVEKSGPPYYTESDAEKLRARYGVAEQPKVTRKPVRWRCLIADPTCATTVEVQALSAYAMRFQQGDVAKKQVRKWSTGRAQYDVWLSLPVLVEHQKRVKFTKMSLGPKGGLIFSDTGDFWGNIGLAARYWLGRGRWAPAIEFTSALAFKLGGRPTRNLAGADPKFQTQRGPVGFNADIGVSLGGFGAIVFGGQYDSPLAREDIPEQFRVSAAGTFYIGFRGNIVWGGPLGAAVLTHGLTQRFVKQPVN